jgi:hypothetical protein
MSYPAIDDTYMIQSLRRKARTARLQACRASPTLEVQLRSLAERYEADAERICRCRCRNRYGNEWRNDQPGPSCGPSTLLKP